MNSGSYNQAEQNQRAALRRRPHLPLHVYDFLSLLAVVILLLGFNPSSADKMDVLQVVFHLVLSCFCIFLCRFVSGAYKQIWRYSSTVSYVKLIVSDFFAGFLYIALMQLIPIEKISFVRAFSLISFNLLIAIAMRLLYQMLYEYINKSDKPSPILRTLVMVISGISFEDAHSGTNQNDKALNTKIRYSPSTLHVDLLCREGNGL